MMRKSALDRVELRRRQGGNELGGKERSRSHSSERLEGRGIEEFEVESPGEPSCEMGWIGGGSRIEMRSGVVD